MDVTELKNKLETRTPEFDNYFRQFSETSIYPHLTEKIYDDPGYRTLQAQVESFLNQRNVTFVREHVFDDLFIRRGDKIIHLPCDFYCPDLDLIIEVDSQFHDPDPRFDKMRYRRRRENDIERERYALLNKIWFHRVRNPVHLISLDDWYINPKEKVKTKPTLDSIFGTDLHPEVRIFIEEECFLDFGMQCGKQSLIKALRMKNLSTDAMDDIMRKLDERKDPTFQNIGVARKYKVRRRRGTRTVTEPKSSLNEDALEGLWLVA